MGKFDGLKQSNGAMAESLAAATTCVADAKEHLELVKVLMAESVMHLGLLSKNKDLVNSQITKVTGNEVDAQQMCPKLLEMARAFAGV